MSNKKKATFTFIILMFIFLAIELVNIIQETKSDELDNFSLVGSIYKLHSLQPTNLANFYKTYFNFYDVMDNNDGIISIGHDAVLLKIDSSKSNRPNFLTFRTEKISRLFRKLISLKVKFKETMKLDKNDKLWFSVFDPDSNVVTFVGQ